MSFHAIYRAAIWLPLLVPAVVVTVVTVLGLPAADVSIVIEILGYSLFYGGLPYLPLAIWGTWWVSGQPEPVIRRMMYRAPLVMVALFAASAFLVGLMANALQPFIAVAIVGSAVIIPLGYAYVALAMWLRATFGPKPFTDSELVS